MRRTGTKAASYRRFLWTGAAIQIFGRDPWRRSPVSPKPTRVCALWAGNYRVRVQSSHSRQVDPAVYPCGVIARRTEQDFGTARACGAYT